MSADFVTRRLSFGVRTIIAGVAFLAVTAAGARSAEWDRSAALAEHRQELMAPAEGTIIGNPDGHITLVEIFDYNCGTCKAMSPVITQLIKENGDIRVVLKPWAVLGPGSRTASKAVLAAVKQKKHGVLHTALLEHPGRMTDTVAMEIAKKVGLDMAQLQSDMAAPQLNDSLEKVDTLAGALQVSGTPTFVVGKTVKTGDFNLSELKELIAASR
jgi:protein-disulfide isomerase